MIRQTRNRMLCIVVVVLLVGIASFVMLSEKTEKHTTKHVKENDTIIPAEKQVEEPSPLHSQETAVLLPDAKVGETGKLLPPQAGASDAELQHFLDNLDMYKIPGTPDPSVLEFGKHLELRGAGKPVDDPYPNLEDFSSDVDYYKASLEFWNNELSKTDDPEIQEMCKTIIASTKQYLVDEEAWIVEAEERSKEKIEAEKMKSDLIELNTELAVLMNRYGSDEDRDLYFEHILLGIPTQIKDETEITIYDRLLKVSEDLDASEMLGSSSFSERLNPL